jgi:hypothetical protein
MTQKLVTTFVLLIFLFLAFALLAAFSTYFDTINTHVSQIINVLPVI